MSTKSKATGAEWLVGAFKRNPEGLLLLAAGAVLMMRQRRSEPQPAGNGTSSIADGAAAAGAYATDVADRTVRQASAMASNASDYTTQMTQRVSEQADRVINQARSTVQSTADRVLNDRPLLVAVAGLAAGAAIASVFRATDLEKETLGPIGDQVVDAASQVGEHFKAATATAGEALKKAADDKGLNKDGLKEVVTEVAEAFKGSITGDGPSQTEPKSGY